MRSGVGVAKEISYFGRKFSLSCNPGSLTPRTFSLSLATSPRKVRQLKLIPAHFFSACLREGDIQKMLDGTSHHGPWVVESTSPLHLHFQAQVFQVMDI